MVYPIYFLQHYILHIIWQNYNIAVNPINALPLRVTFKGGPRLRGEDK